MNREFDRLQRQIQDRLAGDKTIRVMEVGFGQGRHLAGLLQKGCDAYGVDISEEVVKAFQRKYPEYTDRVTADTTLHQKIDILYCSALLEHLDDPIRFIDSVTGCLKEGGFLIIHALPVLNEDTCDMSEEEDICFWKPCHRVIYSLEGLKWMLKEQNFALTDWQTIDPYNNRVLSMHLREGYSEIANIRHSCLRSDKLPSLYVYTNICREAITIRSRAFMGSFLFQKTRNPGTVTETGI
ncbi:MAG: class I SAM-dependent methyltransferase [Sedimentisphaerales bacterium]|nr:class I SAM-dependent methyltransferase [Sedimentisphaerales bacterium]